MDDLAFRNLLLESGVLGTVVAALASSSEGLRGLARATLALVLKTIQVRHRTPRDPERASS